MTDLYAEAARIVQRANVKEGSVKTLVYSSTYRNLRQLFALVSECIKYQSILKDVFGRCECGSSMLDEEIINNDHEMAIVLLYELLIGNGFGRAGFVRKTMRKYKTDIKAAQAEYLKECDATSLSQVLKAKSGDLKALPRYARVNLIKCSVTEAIDKLCEDGWEYVGKLSIDRFQEDTSALGKAQVGLDPLLGDVLVFPANTDLHDYFMVNDGILVLQDKASCVPAHALNPTPGSVVLDSCAAPGNKTSHLASLLKDQGRIIALDRDPKRMATMKSLLERSGAECVEMIVQDFLTLSPQIDEVKDIQMMLVDPSCSGSGIMSPTDRDINSHRLQSLKRFQISLLKHALRFPNVQRVVYSTCSIYQQENEEVVEEVMSNVNKYFHFVPVIPEWPDSRGIESFENHKCFLRLSSEKHLTAGFFVACFQRNESPSNKSVNDNDKESGLDGDEREGGKHDTGQEHDDNSASHSPEVAEDADTDSSRKKKKKKRKERHPEEFDNDDGQTLPLEESERLPDSKGKRVKKNKAEIDRKTEDDVDGSLGVDGTEHSRKKKKKRKHDHEKKLDEDVTQSDCSELACPPKRKKKKKNNDSVHEANNDNDLTQTVGDESFLVENNGQSPCIKKKKKHKKDKEENENVSENCSHEKSISESAGNIKKKKKKKRKTKDEED